MAVTQYFVGLGYFGRLYGSFAGKGETAAAVAQAGSGENTSGPSRRARREKRWNQQRRQLQRQVYDAPQRIAESKRPRPPQEPPPAIQSPVAPITPPIEHQAAAVSPTITPDLARLFPAAAEALATRPTPPAPVAIPSSAEIEQAAEEARRGLEALLLLVESA